MAWHDIWFGISNACGGLWSNGIGKNFETDEEHDEVCVGEGFSWLRHNLTDMVREVGTFCVWGVVVSKFTMG